MINKSQFHFKKTFKYLLIAFLLLITEGCLLSPQKTISNKNASAPFIPPTLSPTEKPTPEPTNTISSPTSAPDCVNILSFMEDLTVPDGTSVAPGETLDKQWKVINSGTCNWDENYSIQLIAGPAMGVESKQALYPAKVGSQAIIQIQFTAPDEIGSHRSAWQAFTPDDQPFGDPFFIEIIVEAQE